MLIFYAKFLANFAKDLPNKEAQVLEQVNHLQSVKKAPFEADILPSQKAQKLSQNGAESSALDFKNALQKSIQSTKSKDTPKDNAKPKSTKQNELNDTKATLPSTLSNALSSTLSNKANPLAHKNKTSSDDEYLLQNALHKSQISPKDALNTLEKNQNTKKPSLDLSKTPTQDFAQDSIASDILQNALLKDKITPKNALGSSEKSSVESTKRHANALNSIAQNSTKAIHSLESGEPLDETLQEPTQVLQDALEKRDTQTPKKDLNQMARNKNQEETFLSKITQNKVQNKANEDVANSADKAGEAGEAGQDELKSIPTPPSVQNTPTASAQDSAKTNTQNLAKSLESSATISAQTPANPTLQTVASKAKELGLNPSNISYQESQEATPSTKADEANATKKVSKVATQASQTSGVKTYFDDDEALRPVFDILESFDAKNAAKRRASNTSASIKYVQNGEDKIAVIERGKSLPKAITASRIKNERQEKIFEQIQKDLLAGKELNLSQIERELSKLENGLFDDKTETINPLKQTPKGIKPSIPLSTQASASIATSAGLSAASALSKDSKDSSKDSKGFASKSAKEAKESSKASAQSTLAKEPSEPLSSTQQRQESILERNLATPQFAQNDEQEALNETLLAQKAQKQESSEAKAESKGEAKTLTSNATSTNPLRSEARTNNINAREALSSFVNQFEQEVKKFKPPMRQISMELSPKELGNIELTITQRGNSLHISVVSNPQALQLFAQNHGELRQNLLNAGFEGVDLSFSSSNGQSGQSGGQNQDSEQSQKGEANSLDSLAQKSQNSAEGEILAMEIALPRYA